MRAGRLTGRFVLQRPSGTSGSGYTDVATGVPGELLFLGGGSESLQVGAQVSTAQYQITIRYRTDVKAEWRLMERDTDRLFQVSHFGDPNGRRIELLLLCLEIK